MARAPLTKADSRRRRGQEARENVKSGRYLQHEDGAAAISPFEREPLVKKERQKTPQQTAKSYTSAMDRNEQRLSNMDKTVPPSTDAPQPQGPGMTRIGGKTVAESLQDFSHPKVDAMTAAQINAARPKLGESVRQFQKDNPVYETPIRKPLVKLGKVEQAITDKLGITKPNDKREFAPAYDRLKENSVNSNALENFLGGVGNTATFGLQRKLDEALYGKSAGAGYDTRAGKTGQIAGMFLSPGAKTATKIGAKLIPGAGKLAAVGRGAVTGGILGGGSQVAAEGIDVGLGGGLNTKERLARVGESTALGAGLGAAGSGLVEGVKAGAQGMKKFATGQAEKLVEGQLSHANIPLRRVAQPETLAAPTPAATTPHPAPVRTPEVVPASPAPAPTPAAPQPTKAVKPEPVAKNPEVEQLDKDFNEYKQRMLDSAKKGQRTHEAAQKAIKARLMAVAAEKRALIQGDSLIPVKGGLTAKELDSKLRQLKSNYTGKEVTVSGKPGKITKLSFGKVGVEFDDGTKGFFDPKDIKPKHDIDALIKNQDAASKAPKPTPAPAPAPEPVTPQPEPIPAPVEPGPPRLAEPIEQQQGVRSNFKTQTESGRFSPEAQAEVNKLDQNYDVAHNVDTVAHANQAMGDITQAEDDFFNDKYLHSGKNAEHTALAYRLMQEFDAKGQYGKVAQISAKITKDLTDQGQGSQAAAIIKRLSPEGQLNALTKMARESGMEVTAKDTEDFLREAQVGKDASGAGIRDNVLIDLLDKLDAGGAKTPEDLATLQSLVDRAKKHIGEEPQPKREPLQKKQREQTKRDKAITLLESQEAAARARIKARRGHLSANPLGEWADHGIVIAAKVAKGVINSSNFVEEIVKEFGEKVRPNAGKIFKAGQKKASKIPPQLKKQTADVEQIVKKFAAKTPMTTKQLKQIRDLAASVKKLEGKKGQEAEIKMQEIMNRYTKSSFTDKVQATRYMAMLWNTLTQGLNALSGAAMASIHNTIDVFGAMLDHLVHITTGRERSTAAFGLNPFEYIAELGRNLKTGAIANFKGVQPGGLQDVSEIKGLAFKPRNWNPLSLGERTLKAVAGGADYMIYKTQFTNEIRKQAKLAASKAVKEGKLGGSRKAFIQKFMNTPTPEAMEIADAAGRKSTFQQKNSVGSVLANGVSSLGNKTGKMKGPGKFVEQGVRVIAPFIRTPLNIAQTGVQMTPVGVVQGLWQLVRATSPEAQRNAISNLGLGITGSGIGYLGWYLSKAGIITGANDSGNKNVDAIREQSGGGKYLFNRDGAWRLLKSLVSGEGWKAAEEEAKFQKGDSTFDYTRLQPITFPMALGAGYKKGSEKGGVVGGLASAGAEGLNALLNMSSVQSIQNLVAPQQGGTATDKNIGLGKKILESYVKSFSPSLLNQFAKYEDTTTRQTPYNQPGVKGVWEDVKGYQQSRTPSLYGHNPFSSSKLPASVTTLGDEKKGASGVAHNFIVPLRDQIRNYSDAAKIISDLIDRTGNESLAPSAPSKKIDGAAIEPKQYEQLQKDVGQEITSKILALPSTLTDAQKAAQIVIIYRTVKKKYTDRIKREMKVPR